MSAALARSPARLALIALAPALAASEAVAQGWTHFAGTAARSSIFESAPPSLAAPAWVASVDESGREIEFIGQAGVVCDAQRVYAVGRVDGESRVLAFAREDGACVWSAPAPQPHASSWSTPALDAGNGAVLVGLGESLIALDHATGAARWQAALQRPVVNASPLVTTDLGPADRAFITDSDGFGDSARLYCVNVDAFDAGANPYQLGEVVWSAAIGSAAGSTPAYSAGLVYIATAGPGGFGAGTVMAFDASSVSEPQPLWTFENVKDAGFFGGIAVAGGAVYTASYAFSGGRSSANLVRLDAATGTMAWSAGCNRTDSTPVVIGDGRIVVSGGIAGFGTLPTVQLFIDHGDSAEMLWDSAAATWQDADANGTIDPGEYVPMGGWMHQPLVGSPGSGPVLLVGAIPLGGESYAPCTDLYSIDLDREAGAPGWIADHFEGTGSTPAAAGGDVYTVGAAGLHAFRGCRADCDRSGGLDLFDFLCFQNAFVSDEPYGDCNGDGAWDLFDFLCYLNRFAEGCG
jgi:outer membrane protein assembly factor BamB